MVAKKVPVRKCLGCGEMFPQKQLVRVVKTKIKSEDGEEAYEISLDLVGKKNGRGAYICKNSECFKIARKKSRPKYHCNTNYPITFEFTESTF